MNKLLIILLLSLSFTGNLYVPSEYPTIADAINAASYGDYIYLAPGIYEEDINLPGEINGQNGEITKNHIHIVGEAGPGSTIVRGNVSLADMWWCDNNDNCHYPTSFGSIEGITLIESTINLRMYNLNLKLSNMVITNNSQFYFNDCYSCHLNITNITAYNNDGCMFSSGYGNPSVSISNSIFTEHTEFECDGGYFMSMGVQYSNIQGGFSGEGNIDVDPLFVDAENGNFSLQSDSPCIDAGNPDSDYNDQCLPPGSGSIRNDMGAYGGFNCWIDNEEELAIIIADFNFDPPSGDAPLIVQFNDLSEAQNTVITSWQWDFDSDGIIDSYEQNPSWIYYDIGNFTITLTVSDGLISETETLSISTLFVPFVSRTLAVLVPAELLTISPRLK